MSVQAISWVFEKSQSVLAPRLVLLSIANHANSRGQNSFPSLQTIALEAKVSPRHVRRALRELEKMGELVTEFNAGRDGTNLFHLPKMGQPEFIELPHKKTSDPGQIVPPDKLSPRTKETIPPDTGVPRTVLNRNKKINNKRNLEKKTEFPVDSIYYTPFEAIAREHGNGWDVNVIGDAFRTWPKRNPDLAGPALLKAFETFSKTFGQQRGRPM